MSVCCFILFETSSAGHDITAVETNLEESKAKITSDTDQVWVVVPLFHGVDVDWTSHLGDSVDFSKRRMGIRGGYPTNITS